MCASGAVNARKIWPWKKKDEARKHAAPHAAGPASDKNTNARQIVPRSVLRGTKWSMDSGRASAVLAQLPRQPPKTALRHIQDPKHIHASNHHTRTQCPVVWRGRAFLLGEGSAGGEQV